MRSSGGSPPRWRSEEHTSELQSRGHLVCRLLLEKKKMPSARSAVSSVRFSPGGKPVFRCAKQPLKPVHRSSSSSRRVIRIFFFNDTATTEIYTLSLHDALPI